MVIEKKQKKSFAKRILKKVFSHVSKKKLKEKDTPKKILKKVLQDIKLDKIKKVLVLKKIKKSIHHTKINHNKDEPLKLNKIPHNPIISPSYYGWESKGTFNPAVFISDDIVHIVYRAVGDDDSSVLGYASSLDGIQIDNRPSYYIYKRDGNYPKTGKRINYISGGGWSGGCEDPRITLIDGVIYLLYTAFDGWGSVRIAMSSILLSDFKKHNWNWKKEVFISPPDELSKNWLLFPEKINGKYAILHSISEGIMIDYFDSLDELDGTKFIKSISHRDREDAIQRTGIRSAGPTPINTKIGWLVMYHISEGGKYMIKAMILDKKDPTKVLYRTKEPILEPEEEYEKRYEQGIVYSCGAVVKNKQLYVYYGGGDKFVCVASIPLKELIDSMKNDKIIKLSNIEDIKTL